MTEMIWNFIRMEFKNPQVRPLRGTNMGHPGGLRVAEKAHREECLCYKVSLRKRDLFWLWGSLGGGCRLSTGLG